MCVKVRDRVQSVKSAPLRVTAAIGQRAQFAKDRDIGASSQGRLHFRHGDNSEALEQVEQRFYEKVDCVHNERITPISAEHKRYSIIITAVVLSGCSMRKSA